ncbi:MAG: hydantoinase B/oxoprolinase family protein [Alphaproteobacteria bacterium]|nr:hydantoinase B/oxoprolinase family protein [Alphaproteobacteria bacterium]
MTDTTTATPGTAVPNRRIDPVTANVIQGALENIAIEMGYKLMRMSYSSIIRESEDFGAALVDLDNRQMAEARQSTPLQSGPIPGYVKGIRRQLGERGETLRPGDVIMHNDPYAGASHGPDVAFIVPAFHDGALVGFAATTAHHLDIGAHTPGSGGIVDAIDCYAEGLRFQAIKVYEEGRRNIQVWHMLRTNLRLPDLVLGDMEAQIAAARIGAQRYVELITRYGAATVAAAAEDLYDSSERRMRAAILALPDGDYSATKHIDGFLDDPDPARRDLPIVVTLKVRGDALTVDLTGTAPQVSDRPINMPLEGTVDCAVWLALRSVLLDSAVHGHIPQNHGLTRPITIVAPKGCLANPIFPAPVIARFCPGIELSNAVVEALSQVVPRQVCAGCANGGGIVFTGEQTADFWVHVELLEGSYGGRFGRDGMDAVDVLYANTRNNPIEDYESHVPLRVNRYELREQAAAAGQWRGGIGTVRETEFLAEGAASVETEGHKYAPVGLFGGKDGALSDLMHIAHDGTVKELPSKLPYFRVHKGDKLIAHRACGGGYGDPFERDPAAVLADVLDGYLAPETAEREYGVAIIGGALDRARTATLRGGRHGGGRA